MPSQELKVFVLVFNVPNQYNVVGACLLYARLDGQMRKLWFVSVHSLKIM